MVMGVGDDGRFIIGVFVARGVIVDTVDAGGDGVGSVVVGGAVVDGVAGTAIPSTTPLGAAAVDISRTRSMDFSTSVNIEWWNGPPPVVLKLLWLSAIFRLVRLLRSAQIYG